MIARARRVVVMASLVAITASCGRSGAPSSPAIALTTPDDGRSYVEVTGLSPAALDALDAGSRTPDEWAAVLRVSVDAGAPPIIGEYTIADSALRFTPAFELDPGRQYSVRFDPSLVPDAGAAALTATVGRPTVATVPSTVVARVYPTGDLVPENLLRMYVEFSAPMGRRSGIEFLTLLDERGNAIEGAFLPLDYEFWSPDHTRFTAFFDPGRVKEGILPNQQMGRALAPGRPVTLVISREWRDEHGLPLKEEFRRVLRVGPPDDQPLDPSQWRLQSPASGSRDAFVVMFPDPLDHGLLQRALGVRRAGQPVAGDIVVDMAETRWLFTPHEPWRAGAYDLIAFDILEDLAGNQIGRAFEVDTFDTVDESPDPKTVTLPFRIG